MRIIVKAYFSLQKATGGKSPIEIENSSATLRELLEDLAKRFGTEFTEAVYDSGQRVPAAHIMLLVNGRNYLSIPERLETPLKDGDEIALFPPLAGG